MLAKDQQRGQINKKLSDQFQQEESKSREPSRGIEGTTSGTDESLFGSFIKSRQANAAFQGISVEQTSSSGDAKEERIGVIPERRRSLDPSIDSQLSLRKSVSTGVDSADILPLKKPIESDFETTMIPTPASPLRKQKQRKSDSTFRESSAHSPVSPPKRKSASKSTADFDVGKEGSSHSPNSTTSKSPHSKKSLDLKSPLSNHSKHSSHHHRHNRSPKVRSPSGTQGKSPKITTAGIRQEMKQTLKAFPDLHIGDSNHRTPRSSPSAKIRGALSDEMRRAISDPPVVADDVPPKQARRSSVKSTTVHESNSIQGGDLDSHQSTLGPAKYYDEDTGSVGLDSIPPLVDDAIQRDNLEGIRGGKQWNILEDTPGGHAPEKLAIVTGVDYSSEDEREAFSKSLDESVDEDDDIVDEDNYTLNDSGLGRPNRSKALPRDPVEQDLTSLMQSPTIRPVDRFNPTFQNSDMWRRNGNYASGVDGHESGDISLLSDQGEDLDTVSELATTFTDENTLTNHTTDISSSGRTDNSESADRTKTPATTKRTGGRRQGNSPAPMPILDQSTRKQVKAEEDIKEHRGDIGYPEAVPEYGQLYDHGNTSGRAMPTSRVSMTHQKAGSSSSGKSSRRRVEPGHTQRHSGKRRAKRNNIPEVVQGTGSESMSPIGRSPLSSSITSTPNSHSMASSGRQVAAMQMQILRQNPPRARRNTPLNLHVGRESHSNFESDDHTLGASTITTNFSATQRTIGDNTVSTRSLFQSEKINRSDSLKIPQRRRGEDSDDEDNDVYAIAASTEINANFELLAPNEKRATQKKPIDRYGQEPPVPNSILRATLRRPSEDDLLDTIDAGNDEISYPSSTGSKSEVIGRGSSFVQLTAENPAVLVTKVVSSLDQERLGDLSTSSHLKESVEFEVGYTNLDMEGNEIGGRQHSKLGDLFVRGSSDHVHRSPKEDGKGKKKKSRLGLFKRVKSWKGVVALSDDDDERNLIG